MKLQDVQTIPYSLEKLIQKHEMQATRNHGIVPCVTLALHLYLPLLTVAEHQVE